MLINSVLLESADTAGVSSDEPVETIPPKVGKYLFRREIFWNFAAGSFGTTRRCRPPEGDRQRCAQADLKAV
jgi:hypothetical protein